MFSSRRPTADVMIMTMNTLLGKLAGFFEIASLCLPNQLTIVWNESYNIIFEVSLWE